MRKTLIIATIAAFVFTLPACSSGGGGGNGVSNAPQSGVCTGKRGRNFIERINQWVWC